MRVLYILHSTGMGGATISFINMIEGLNKKGYKIYIVAPNFDETFTTNVSRFSSGNFRVPLVCSICPKPDGFFGFIKFCMFFCPRWILQCYKKKKSLNALSSIVEKIKPDLIHTNTGVIHEGFICAKQVGIPHIWHLREYQDNDFNWHVMPSIRLFRKQLKESYVISITKDILNHFRMREDEKHRVIYNGVFRRADAVIAYPKETYFLCASRVSASKGIKDVIVAFARVHSNFPQYKLRILGFGDDCYISEMKALCADLMCSDSVFFEGYHQNVKPFMVKAKALIVASYYEGFGRMTAEASFCGCLVIGRNTGGTKEILDEIGGLQFSDVVGLEKMMIKVASENEDYYKIIIETAQEKALNLYSVEKNVEEIDQFYNYIIQKSSKVQLVNA